MDQIGPYYLGEGRAYFRDYDRPRNSSYYMDLYSIDWNGWSQSDGTSWNRQSTNSWTVPGEPLYQGFGAIKGPTNMPHRALVQWRPRERR